jgi:hypothetical protein
MTTLTTSHNPKSTPKVDDKELAGDILTWDIPSKIVKVSLLRDAATAAGLDADMIQDLQHKSAFTRATNRMVKGLDKIVERVSRDGTLVRHQFTYESKTDAMINHVFEAVVELDVKTGTVTPVTLGQERLAIDIERYMAEEQTRRNSGDITRMVKKLCRDNADLWPINKNKGVAYFCPSEFHAFADKLERWMTDVTGDPCALSRFPIRVGTERGKQALSNVLRIGMDQLLSDLEKATQAFNMDPEEGSLTRKGTVAKKVSEVEAVVLKLEAYDSYLDSCRVDFRMRATEINRRFQRQLTTLTEAKEKKNGKSEPDASGK